MTIYEIDNAIQEALEAAIDPETGELTDEALLADLEELQMERNQKVENIICFIKNLDGDAKAIRDEEKALAARRKTAERRSDSLRKYLQWALGGEKFSSARGSVSFRRSKQVEVDENRLFEVPEQYLRYKDPEPDKKAISEALKAGEEVPGCRLVENVSMIIK